jgi:hypothetical protein
LLLLLLLTLPPPSHLLLLLLLPARVHRLPLISKVLLLRMLLLPPPSLLCNYAPLVSSYHQLQPLSFLYHFAAALVTLLLPHSATMNASVFFQQLPCIVHNDGHRGNTTALKDSTSISVLHSDYDFERCDTLPLHSRAAHCWGRGD